MKLKSIQTKLLTILLAVLLVVFSITVGIIINSTRNMAVQQATDLAMAESREYAQIIENELEEGFSMLRVLAEDTDLIENKNVVKELLANDHFNNIWISYEDNFNQRYHIENDELIEAEITHDYIIDNTFDSETILEPYTNLQGIKVSSLVVPIKEDDQVVGNIGVAVDFARLQEIIDGFDIFETGFARLLSNQGIVIAHPDEDRRWDESGDFEGEQEELYRDTVQEGKYLHDDAFSVALDDNVFKSFAPVNLGDTDTPWSFGVVAPHEEMFAGVTSLTFRIIIISVISFILLSIIILLITKPIVNKIKKLKGYAIKIADGNLNLDIDEDLVESKDELGNLAYSFKEIKNNLSSIIESTKDISQTVSAHSQELSAAAEEGNASIETTHGLIQNMSAGIEEISASAQEVASFSEQASQQTSIGSGKIAKTVNSIDDINESIKETVATIDELDNISEEIGQIVELITNISEQTNLLALNAAIEAARAGEHGQGFAVVADEIRELAQETSEATEKISDLINKTQSQSEKGIKEVREVESKSQESQNIAQETGEVFEEIKAKVEETSLQTEQTAIAANDIAESSEDVISATEDINKMSDEITNSSQELAQMAEELQSLINQFNL